jgi:glycosyltransferase involved in cell wall biosynthesis
MEVFPPLPTDNFQRPWVTNPAHICIASYELLGPSRNGGIGTAYSALASALTEAGHQVTLLYLFGDWYDNGTVSEWRTHYHSKGIEFCPLPASAHSPEGPQSLNISLEAYRWLKTRDFDIIHFPELLGHGFYSVLAKHQGLDFRNTLICVGVHSPISWIREVNGELPFTLDEPEIDFMERESVALADAVISPSQYLLNWMQANGWSLPPATYVQQYVLSPELWAAWHNRTETSESQRITGLTFFGRLEERKGLALFCDALDLLVGADTPRFTVSFLGKSARVAGRDAIGYIEDRARNWNFAWQIVSDRDQHGALDFLRQGGRLAVIPSLVDNLPNAVLECLCAQIPFVTSCSGGIPEAIAPEHREHVTFSVDPQTLAGRLRVALLDGVRFARPAIDPEKTRREWVAWHQRPIRPHVESFVDIRDPEPRVSVCLTQPARPELLRQQLATLQTQSWRDLEIIVAAAGAGSDSEAELEFVDVAGNRKGLRTINRRKSYYENIRDIAASNASGKYVLFLDSHTFAKPEQVRILTEIAEYTRLDVLTSFLDLYVGNGRPDEGIKLGCRQFLGPALISGLFRNYFGQGAIFVRKEALLRIGGFASADWRPCDDWEFLAKVALSGLRMEVVPKALAWYRVDNNLNLTGENGNGDEACRLRPYLQAVPLAFRDLIKIAPVIGRQSDKTSMATSNGHDASLLSEAELLKILYQRLAMGGNRRIASFLKEWAEYNTSRANLPKGRLERLPGIVRELFKGNYHRFGHGLGSAFRDLRRAPKLSGPSKDV